MSSRNFRRMCGGSTLPDPDGSDGDFDPYSQPSTSGSYYQGLEIYSVPEPESDDTIKKYEESVPANFGKKKKYSKKIAKVAQSSIDESDNEVENAVRFVNSMLGEQNLQRGPSPDGQPERVSFMQVQNKHLNVNYEIIRKFGKEVLPFQKRSGRQHPMMGFGKKCKVVPMDKYKFRKNGLSMSVDYRSNSRVFFTFDHDNEYQQQQREFILLSKINSHFGVSRTFKELKKAEDSCHIELMLEYVDILFAIEAHNKANHLLNLIIAYMQYAASPRFDVTDMNTRLDYAFIENRPFHVALLKYLYMLSNRACHRTALEVAKLLLNLDSSDPLAVIMIIDVLALRAREHGWLIDAVTEWEAEGDNASLYNIQYSLALAKYHLSMKEKAQLIKATELLERAMIHFPSVVMSILEYAGQSNDPILKEHPYFTIGSKITTSEALKKLTSLYAALVWQKWREPGIMEWFIETAKKLCWKVDEDITYRNRALMAEEMRRVRFSKYSVPAMRHINVILPMSKLVAEDWVPILQDPDETVFSANPNPSKGFLTTVNRYRYRY